MKKLIYPVLLISMLLNIIAAILFARELYIFRHPSTPDFMGSEKYNSILHEPPVKEGAEIDKRILINTVIDKFNYDSYLEIGQGRAENNFNWIKCRIKIGVDPDPLFNAAFCTASDDFFNINMMKFDLIFIDGLHHADQAYRDIINALACLTETGTILVHDCNPRNEEMQAVPRRQDIWTGDVWKAWVKLRSEATDLEMFVIDNDTGLGVIRRGRQEVIGVPGQLSYPYFEKNKKNLLNLKPISYFQEYLRQLQTIS